MLVTTLRIIYTKENYMSFLGHLELMKLFERVFRFNKLPLKFSEGFNPIPKMTYASPLSVGYSSKGEVMEVQLESEMPLNTILNLNFPEGIKVIDAAYVNSKKSLMASLSHSEYLIKVEFKQSIEQLPVDEWISAFLNQSEVLYEKKAKNGNMRSINIIELIHTLKMVYKSEHELILRAIIQTGSQGSLNPETLVNVMCKHFGIPHEIDNIRIERLQLLYEEENKLLPLFEMRE
ncbi:TIGR03936 family radical SAM-associated protein [Fusibacter bizertensis]